MLRAIIFFVVFTIAATAPTPVQNDARNKLYNGVGTDIDKNLLLNAQSEENEIPEERPFKVGFNLENETENGDFVKKILIATNMHEILNYSDEENITDKQHSNVNEHGEEDINDNLINIDHPDTPESKLSEFVTVLVEFMKSIVEQILSITKR